MRGIRQGSWSIACVCMVLGFMLAVQFRTTQDIKGNVPFQRVEELSARLLETEQERDGLREELKLLRENTASSMGTDELRKQAGFTALEGEGIIVRMDDSTMTSKAGENPNLYLIHDDDLLRVINELRAAGAEAISVNGQRLIGTSEIRCAGPTLSVNNVRSSAPFEIRAIGEKKTLENAIKMRGGVAETLKVWGIQLETELSDNVRVPAYKGSLKFVYGHEIAEQGEAQ
ncbi:MAG: DUF881 domain-containing protein [Selenomonadaceae bacterium]|nr:DUF881 domain-containing protein [Selenomonadaceae bacterium]MBR0283802.1 DUF881 domain-containing protein [Selenomonadaceae bacterium]MBR6711261.1 DUF881 domain-containing protein [Selenomonadaceae bacterium]